MVWVKIKKKPKALSRVVVYFDKMTGDLVVKKGTNYSKLRDVI